MHVEAKGMGLRQSLSICMGHTIVTDANIASLQFQRPDAQELGVLGSWGNGFEIKPRQA